MMINKKSLFFLVTAAILGGCSTSTYDRDPYNSEGSAERAGKYIDQGISRVRERTAKGYKQSKEWARDKSNRFSRGSAAFKEQWRQGEDYQGDDADNYEADDEYDRRSYDRRGDDQDSSRSFRWNEKPDYEAPLNEELETGSTEPRFDEGDSRY
jgi:hypothetical protein